MNYKRIAIFLTFMLLAAAFCGAGIYVGRHDKFSEQKVYAAPDKRERKESEKIAVVNLDEGVSGKDGQVNYAQRLSKFPCMDFEYASLEAARTGLETGRYGAYVIIPAAFSQNVESINTEPQVSQIEYRVNQSYSGKRQYELLYNVRSYIDSLNNHLSYMYVDNILREFHDAQDKAVRVMENDLKDMEAIEKIKTQDLVTLVEIPEMPKEETMPEALDISKYTARSVGLSERLEEEYANNIRDIQREIESISAGGLDLSKQLKTLSGQVREIQLTKDENGEDIAGKAEEKLRVELERQSKQLLEKEKILGYLKKFKDDNEELIKRFEQPEDTDQPVSDDDGCLQWVISSALKQNQEIDSLLEEMEQTKELDMDRITELVKTEYVDTLNINADRVKDSFLKRYAEELTVLGAYNEQLSGFKPQADDVFLAQSIQDLRENHRIMQEELLDNQQAYMEFAQKSAASSREYTKQLQKHAAEAKEASEEALAQGLGAAKERKEKSSAMNQGILGGFSSKLKYTRIGSAEYARVYQFIANPLSAVDRSVNQAAANP